MFTTKPDICIVYRFGLWTCTANLFISEFSQTVETESGKLGNLTVFFLITEPAYQFNIMQDITRKEELNIFSEVVDMEVNILSSTKSARTLKVIPNAPLKSNYYLKCNRLNMDLDFEILKAIYGERLQLNKVMEQKF